MADLEFFTQSVRIKVDGRPYVGRMDIDALGELQRIWKIETLGEMQQRVENVGFAEMKDIVFVSLLSEQPKITREQSDKVANAMGMNGIVRYVTDVMKASSAPAEAVQRGPTRPAKRRKNR